MDEKKETDGKLILKTTSVALKAFKFTSVTDEEIKNMIDMYSGMEITEGDTKSLNDVVEKHKKVKKVLSSLEKERKELASVTSQIGKQFKAEAVRLKDLLEPLLKELGETRKVEEDRKQKIKDQKDKAEKERVKKIKEAISCFENFSTECLSSVEDSETLSKSLIEVENYDTSSFQEFTPEVESKKKMYVKKLSDKIQLKKEQEEEKIRLDKEKERQDKVAAKQKSDADELAKEKAKLAADKLAQEEQNRLKEEELERRELVLTADGLMDEALKDNAEFDLEKEKAKTKKLEADKKIANDKAIQDKEDADNKATAQTKRDKELEIFNSQKAEQYLVDDYDCYESIYLETKEDIKPHFQDCGRDFLDCGQGYYEEEATIFCKIGTKYYNVIISAEIESSKQDRGDRLYWVEKIESVIFSETEKPAPKEKGVFIYSVQCTDSQSGVLFNYIKDNIDSNVSMGISTP